MKVMILAAGEGRRMLPLTQNCPKPLLKVNGLPLLDIWLRRLEAANQSGADFEEVIVNAAYLSEQIVSYIERRDNRIPISVSVEPYPLETAGAICYASLKLGDDPFLLINGDVYAEVELSSLVATLSAANICTNNQQSNDMLGALLLVKNPTHNTAGDFFCRDDGVLCRSVDNTFTDLNGMNLTFAGISVLSPKIITDYPNKRKSFALREVFSWAIAQQRLAGRVHKSYWLDVGTPNRLKQLENYLLTR